MYTTTNDAEGPYFIFTPLSLFVRNTSYGRGEGVISFLDPYIRVPLVTRADEFFSDAMDDDLNPFVLAILILFIFLLAETLTFSLLLSSRHGTVSPLSLSLYRNIQTVRHFRFDRVFTRKNKNDMTHQSRLRIRNTLTACILGILIVTVLLAFQFLVIAFSHRSVHPVLNSQRAFEIIQPINPDWNTVWNASRKLINQPCVTVNIINSGSGRTRLNNCLTSTLPANRFEPYQPVQPDTILNASIISDIHAYGADHVLTIDGQSVEFVARSYFSLNDMQERLMKQRSQLFRINRQMLVIHQQFFAYLYSSYVRMTGDSSLTLQHLQELQVEQLREESGAVRAVSQTAGGSSVFQTTSVRFETRFHGVMPRGLAALRFGQAFFKGMIGVQVRANDVNDLIAGVGVTAAEAVLWSERRRKLNWLALLVINGVLGVAVLFVRIWLKATDELEVGGDGRKESAGISILTEAREDDGEREFRERSMRIRSLGAELVGERLSTKAGEYPAPSKGDYQI